RAAGWLLAGGGVGAVLILGPVEDRAGGSLEAAPVTRAEVRAPVAGFLREVFYDEGDRVPPGATVARLEVPDLDSQLAQKQAAVREAAARVRLLEEGARPEAGAEQRGRVARARSWRDLAGQDLARSRDALRETLDALDKQIAQCRAEEEYYHTVMTQATQLLGQQAISTREYREAEKEVQVARAREQQAQA